jgi:pseudouridylate synthase
MSGGVGSDVLRVAPEVLDARRDGRPVVAMESTVFSCLGLPEPANREALDGCVAVVRAAGGVPAVTAVLDGVARVGLDPHELDRVLTAPPSEVRKCAERDLAPSMAAGAPIGATTVSASLALAHAAGLAVFATGGIGGVHRDVVASGDVSADLDGIARRPLVTVCAGAKAFLDLARTLEHLEAAGVAVLGYGTDELPAFTSRTSGLRVPHRVDEPGQVAAVVRAARAIGVERGVLVTVPCPADAEIPWAEVSGAIDGALEAAARAGVTGAAVTPFVLAAVARATDGRSVPANVALVRRNAEVAVAIAAALTPSAA